MNRIAVLIPCYNEELTIARVVTDFRAQLPEAEIYVYDNNSTDKTAEEARRAGAIVRREPRQGKGNVIRSMFRQVDADCYLMVDGDDTYSALHACEMCRLVLEEGADMVIGNRLSSTYLEVNRRPLHNSGNLFVRWLINKLFHSEVHDIMTGYRAMGRAFVKHFPVLSKGFEIETEMTIHALDHNLYVEEIPVEYRNRPDGSESKLNTVSDGFRVLKTIFLLFRDYRPFLFFSSIAYVLAAVAVVLMIPVYREYLQTGLVPRFPTLIGSGFILLFAIVLWAGGLILEVIGKKHRQLYELLLNRSAC
ncbi:MAG: glycosyltransferase [Bacteroidaceae bacterium]|nr:glycosyltransferase [Bacteroidaceae bacterium]MBR1788418.1 glycosyltransferase [Bacteroidaceae bacterium]